MNPKRLIPFAVVLLVLLVVVALIKGRSPQTKLSEEVELHTVVPASVRLATTQKIEIIDQENRQITMSKENERWQITSLFDATADNAKLDRFLNSISGLTGEERSSSAAVLDDYQLNDNQAATLNLYTDSKEIPQLSLRIGKSLGYRNSFVRLEGENKVYLVNLDLSKDLGLTDEDFDHRQNNWADKRVLTVNRNSVVKVKIKSPEEEFTLTRKEEIASDQKTAEKDSAASHSAPAAPQIQWFLAGVNTPLIEVNKVLNSLNNVNATKLIDPGKAEELGLDKPAYHLEVTTKEGIVKSFSAVKGSEDQVYFARNPSTKVIYQISENIIKQLFKSKKELFGMEK